MQELQNSGYIYKEHGKGTFVAPKVIKQDLLKFYSFTEEMEKSGKVPESKVTDFQIIKCTKKLSEKLRCNIDDELYKIVRLRLADGEHMMYEVAYLPVSRFPQLYKEELDKDSMYNIFKKKYNVTFTKAEEVFKPVRMKDEEAKVLKVDIDVPAMMIQRITFEKDTIIEYSVGIARGDRFEYRVVLEK